MGQQQQPEEAHRHHHAALPTTAADAAALLPAAAPAPAGASRLFTAGLVAAWYASNIGVLLLNKYLLSVYGFRFPVFLTGCHMTACALLSCLAHRASRSRSRSRSRAQLARVAVLGAVFCASVVAGNVSLRFLPVSFNQAVGATTPFFTALLAYAVAGRREACATYAALLPVVAGVVIATGVGRAQLPPLRLPHVRRRHRRPGAQDRAAGDPALVGGGEDGLHGPAPLHGAGGRAAAAPRHARHGARRVRRRGGAREGGPQLPLDPALQLLPRLLGQPHQLPRHQAHQPAHPAGPRECQGRRRRRRLHPDFQEPRHRRGDAGLRDHGRRRRSVRRGQEEEQVRGSSIGLC